MSFMNKVHRHKTEIRGLYIRAYPNYYTFWKSICLNKNH